MKFYAIAIPQGVTLPQLDVFGSRVAEVHRPQPDSAVSPFYGSAVYNTLLTAVRDKIPSHRTRSSDSCTAGVSVQAIVSSDEYHTASW